jgi:hypothetical protein
MSRLLPLLSALLVASPAMAEEPWMWGVGPRVGVDVAPTDRLGASAEVAPFSPVTWDVALGADAAIYPVNWYRIRTVTELQLGQRWVEGSFAVTWNYVPRIQQFQIPMGVGAGAAVGRATAPTGERIRRSTLPLVAEIGVLEEHRRWAWQVMAVGSLELPAGAVLLDGDGARTPLTRSVAGTLGVEASILFGDFHPPRVK